MNFIGMLACLVVAIDCWNNAVKIPTPLFADNYAWVWSVIALIWLYNAFCQIAYYRDDR